MAVQWDIEDGPIPAGCRHGDVIKSRGYYDRDFTFSIYHEVNGSVDCYVEDYFGSVSIYRPLDQGFDLSEFPAGHWDGTEVYGGVEVPAEWLDELKVEDVAPLEGMTQSARWESHRYSRHDGIGPAKGRWWSVVIGRSPEHPAGWTVIGKATTRKSFIHQLQTAGGSEGHSRRFSVDREGRLCKC